MSAEPTKVRRTERLGIQIDDTPYCRGYWARFDGDPRPSTEDGAKTGWDDCDEELREERSEAARRGVETRRRARVR